MKRFYLGYLVSAVCAIASPAFAAPSDAPQNGGGQASAPYDDKLLGDLGGARTTLADEGIDINLHYEGDLWDVLGGGKKRIATYLDYTELRANFDGEKLFGIKGNTISLSFTNSNGTRTNGSTVGSLQGVDNSEVNSNGTRLYEAWVQQNFLDDRISVRLGLQDLNDDSEFASTPITDNFLQPQMQLGQSLAGSGRNGPSSYPYESIAGRVKVKPTEDTYVAFGAYDGVPGDPRTTSGDDIHFNRKDGLLLVSEVGFSPDVEGAQEGTNKLAIGVWDYTSGLPNIDNPTSEDYAQGFYVLSSYQFYHDAAMGRDVSAVVRGGGANDDTQQTDWDFEAALVANGWVPTRPNSEIGLSVAQAHNGAAYMHAQEAAGDASEHLETEYELYYRDQIAQGIKLQPDVQYVVNPDTDPTIHNAWIAGMRLDVTF